MSDFGYFPAVSRLVLDDSGSNYKTAITSGGSNHTKGSYVQLFSSTPFAASGLVIEMQNDNASVVATLYDIAIGAAAAEQIILPNVFFFIKQTSATLAPIILPVGIPAGSRVAVRTQSSLASKAQAIRTQLVALNGALPFQRATDYGTDSANSRGTAITAGTSNAKGSYAQLTASTTNDIKYVMICIGANNGNAMDWSIDLAVGAAGSEVIIVPDIYLTEVVISTAEGPIIVPLSVPAGTRLSARAKCTTNSSVVYMNIIGFG